MFSLIFFKSSFIKGNNFKALVRAMFDIRGIVFKMIIKDLIRELFFLILFLMRGGETPGETVGRKFSLLYLVTRSEPLLAPVGHI